MIEELALQAHLLSATTKYDTELCVTTFILCSGPLTLQLKLQKKNSYFPNTRQFFHNCNNLFKSYNGQRYSVSVVVKSLTGLAWHTHIHRGSGVPASLTCGQNRPFLPYSWGTGHSRSFDDKADHQCPEKYNTHP